MLYFFPGFLRNNLTVIFCCTPYKQENKKPGLFKTSTKPQIREYYYFKIFNQPQTQNKFINITKTIIL